MSNTIDLIKNHRSIREYLDKDIPEELVDEILKSAQAMPNSINWTTDICYSCKR